MSKLQDLIKEYEDLFMYGGIQQSYEELEQLVNEIGSRKFDSMAEIGVADGGTLWLYSQLFGNEGCKIILTDMDIRPIAKRVVERIKKRINAKFIITECNNYDFKLTQPVEFLHIDGDHDFTAVRNDFYSNNNMVKESGYIVIHDTLLMEGPIRFRLELEGLKINMKTFGGPTVLCDCFASNRGNPRNLKFGTTVIIK